jgi:methionine-rich copper-binding protein CopC
MKKLITGILLIACCVIVPSQTSFAHVLITDEMKTKGAILHIIPDDDPVAGEQSTLYFDTQDQLSNTKSTVELTIQSESIEDQKMNMKVDGSLATATYTFPTQGVYNLTFTVSSGEQSSIFKQSQRVSRGVSTSPLEKPTYPWAEILVLASGIGFAVLAIIAFNRRKDIAKHSTL